MADLDDILTALTTLVSGAIYVNGATVVGAEVKVYPGWPTPNVLDTDLAAGIAHVSIYPRPEERNTTRYPVTWQETGGNSAVQEVGRQERLFQIVIWAPTPDIRKAIAATVDSALRQTPRFVLPDDTTARLTYKSSPVTDMLQKAAIYRRDLFYTVEYATTVTATFTPINKFTVNIQEHL